MDAMMQALLGGDALTDDDKLRQTANALRGSDNAAQVFSMSSIAPIAKAAQNQRSLIQDAATRGGRARQIGLERAANRKQREADLERERLIREENRKNQIADRDENNRVKQLIKAMGVSGKTTAGKDGKPVIPPTKAGWAKKSAAIDEDTNMLGTIDEMLNTDDMSTVDFTEDWRYQHGALSKILGGELSDEAKDRQRKWSNYRRYIETPERHKFYGGALTAPEIKEYQKIKIQPGMDKEEIKIRLKAMKNLMLRAAMRGYNDLEPSMNREQLSNKYSGVIDNFIFDDSGRVTGLNVDTSNEGLMKAMDEYIPLKERQRANITPQQNEPAAARQQSAPVSTAEAALSEVGMDAGSFENLAETDPAKFNELLDNYPALEDLF